MEVSNDEEKFVYSIEVDYLKGDYYKVKLLNQTNNHEQIILKNKEDVYVITPALNKSFKFQSEWPDNSSQAYLFKSITNDILNDKDAEVEIKDDGYIIKSKVNYPNNEELKYQKVTLNKDKDIESVAVYNDKDIIKIKVNFTSFDKKIKLSTNDFKLENFVKEEANDTNVEKNNGNVKKEEKKEDNNNINNNENGNVDNNTNNTNNTNTTNNNTETNTNTTCTGSGCNDNKKTANIENIIYPLYIPSNTYLTSSEKIQTDNGNRIILTFGGEKNFVLIEEATIRHDIMEIVPVYGEPLMLTESIGALSANSLTWDKGNISYYLASTELSIHEMTSIANSLGNNTLVINTK